MSLDTDIERISQQERALSFSTFNEDSAWNLGGMMRDHAGKLALPLVIDIQLAGRPLFYCALNGTAAENADWVRRKVNTVMRFSKSSYRVSLEYKKRGIVFDQSRGVDPINFALAGGGFPIRLDGSGVFGAVTVSGAPQRHDHEFVVECLCMFLGKDFESLRLPEEHA